MRVVLDTNVIYAALHSQRGASYTLLKRLRAQQFEIALSVALCLEYEDVLLREPAPIPVPAIHDVLDVLVAVSVHPTMYFLWRPQLRDPKDDHVLELAINGRCSHIVTFNGRDFQGCDAFGIHIISPAEFLVLLGGLP